MVKRIPVGIEDYRKIIDKDYYYVDKTLLVREILDAGVQVSLFTRPRRFGKTLALSMLQTFFEDERDADGNPVDNSRYFEGKAIDACKEEYRAEQGKYPVINLTLKSAKQPDYEMAYHNLKSAIAGEFERHLYVLKGNALMESEKLKYSAICSRDAKEEDYTTALAFLSKCLKKYHDKSVVVLLDEYDVPLENAYFAGFYDRMLTFVRSLFESVLKTNPALEFAVITGCLRITRESIFTGLNNLRVVSVLNRNYAECFGFTPGEVRTILAHYGLEKHLAEVREWYDGYLFGNVEIYNPWSIVCCVEDNRNEEEFILQPYWANTSSNDIIKQLVEEAGPETRAEIEKLMTGGIIEKPVHEEITYGDIHESQDNLWNFLFFTGYLKNVGRRFEDNETYLQLMIPNEEIRYIYKHTILSWFDRRVKAMDRKPLYQALLAGDCEMVEEALNEQLAKSISFYDAAEQFYHGFMVGMLGNLGEYRLRSNRESGDGRADLMMVPENGQMKVLIFEFKKTEKFTQMDALCDAALCQIEEKHYDAECKEEGYTKFVKYGICFCRKSCRVKVVVENGE